MRLNHELQIIITAKNEFDLRIKNIADVQTINFREIEKAMIKEKDEERKRKDDIEQEKKRGTGYIKSIIQGEAVIGRYQDVAPAW
jgi:hypothetical protein